MPDASLVYVPCKDKDEARTIAKELLDERLVACANFFPVESMFRWKGSIDSSSEIVRPDS